MSLFWSPGGSRKRGVVLTLPLQRLEKAHRRPTTFLFLHRQSSAKLPPSSQPPLSGIARQGRKNHKLNSGGFGCSPGSLEAPATRQGSASFPGHERWWWRTSRSSSSMVALANRASGSRDKNPWEQTRKLGHYAHPSGTSKRSFFFPPPQVRFFFWTCRLRKELGGLGDYHCQANGEERPLRRQGKSSKSKKLAKKKFEQFSDHPLSPFSDQAARHRDRCYLP